MVALRSLAYWFGHVNYLLHGLPWPRWFWNSKAFDVWFDYGYQRPMLFAMGGGKGE